MAAEATGLFRWEDDALLRGCGRFTDDRSADGALTLAFVRSPYGAGRIVALDLEAARAVPGVRAVATAADLAADGVGVFEPRLRHPGPEDGAMRVPPFPPLADGAVRYCGEPVVAILAESRAAAEDAAEVVEMDIEQRAAVTDALEAAAPDAPCVWERYADNLCFRVEKGDGAAVEAAMAQAHKVVRARLRVSRVAAAPLETRALLASWDSVAQRWRLDAGTQAPRRVAVDLGRVMGVEPDAIRVVAGDVGGGFGMKNAAYPEQAVALWAARRFGAPVRWRPGRLEAFLSDSHGRDQWAEAALALDEGGRFLALDVRFAAGLGAYIAPATPHSPVANLGGLAGVYRTPAIRAVVEGWFTNTVWTAPYRGAGRPEATYVIERMIDLAAAEVGVDRVALRRRNMVRPEETPFRTGLAFTYDSGDFPRALDRALDTADWAGFAGRRAESERRGRLRGAGLAMAIEIAGGPQTDAQPEFARLAATPDGSAELVLGSSDSGQGHATAFRRLLAERLGLDPTRISVTQGDSGEAPKGVGSFGSRTLSAAGTATAAVARAVADRLVPLAADMLEVAPDDVVFEAGAYRIAGADRAVWFPDVLAAAQGPVVEEMLTGAAGGTFPNGCHICEVEIDPETGAVALDRYAIADDAGVVLNPDLVVGQLQGGVAQGIGQALMEAIRHDPDGALLTASFMDYAMPRATDVPGVRMVDAATPTERNPLGVKGIGEAGTVGALAAAMSAVADALAARGVRHVDMPATPRRVWEALQAAGRD